MSKIFEAMDKVRRQRGLGSRSSQEQSPGPVPVPPLRENIFDTPPRVPEIGNREHLETSEPDLGHIEGSMVVTEGQFGAPDPHLVSLVKPECYESERYRTLRHFVEQRKREGSGLIVAVTSPAYNDGKTLTSLNLAGALAQEQQARVLVVDTDLRQPKVARYLKQKSVLLGLGKLVSDRQAGLADAIRYHRRYNLNVLASPATVTSAPYEILKSERLVALLGETRRHFDYVVLDLPPTTYPDCQVLERNVDGVLLVVAADRTPRKLIESARDSLDASKLLGLVYNRDRERLEAYYYKAPKISRNGRGRS